MKVIWLLVVSLFMSPVFAGTLKDKGAAKSLVDAVMKKIEEGKTIEGVDLVKDYLVIPMSEFETIKNQINMQAPMIAQRFGKTVGVELVEIEEVGNSLMLVTYLQKFEMHVMRWKFYFYKPKDGWVLNTFSFDDKIQMMFKN